MSQYVIPLYWNKSVLIDGNLVTMLAVLDNL